MIFFIVLSWLNYLEHELKCVYWISERTRYMLVVIVDWWQGAYIRFGEHCLICIWLALNNLFGKVLVHPLLLAIHLFIHKVEKENHCIREEQGNCKYLWDNISNCFKKNLSTASIPLGVIHKWDSSLEITNMAILIQ